ncbi:MAG: acyltransferase [Gammaproteobacteria bacterium]|nr:MAG: acyltransferase [Gammaproteobacteria bacterium]UTW42084.1 acyltransferase [bacterium SCSIO 12844]
MINTTNHRDNNFDFLRFIAALLVIMTHAVVLTGTGIHPLKIFSGNQLRVGDLAVDVFFTISGFLITASFLRSQNIKRYLYARILRIMPALFFMLITAAFIVGPIITTLSYKEYMSSSETYTFVCSVFLYTLQYHLPGVIFSDTSLTYPTTVSVSVWSLPYEFTFYLLIPVFSYFKLLKKEILLFLFVFVILCYSFEQTIIPDARSLVLFPNINLSLFLRVSSMFLSGMLFYYYKDVIIYRLEYFLISILLLIVSCYLGIGLRLLLPICGTYCIFYIAYSPKLKFLNHFGKYGDFSYGMYIYGAFIQQVVIWFFGGNMNYILNIIISMPLAIVCGILSWHLVEKKFLALKKRKLISTKLLAKTA